MPIPKAVSNKLKKRIEQYVKKEQREHKQYKLGITEYNDIVEEYHNAHGDNHKKEWKQEKNGEWKFISIMWNNCRCCKHWTSKEFLQNRKGNFFSQRQWGGKRTKGQKQSKKKSNNTSANIVSNLPQTQYFYHSEMHTTVQFNPIYNTTFPILNNPPSNTTLSIPNSTPNNTLFDTTLLTHSPPSKPPPPSPLLTFSKSISDNAISNNINTNNSLLFLNDTNGSSNIYHNQTLPSIDSYDININNIPHASSFNCPKSKKRKIDYGSIENNHSTNDDDDDHQIRTQLFETEKHKLTTQYQQLNEHTPNKETATEQYKKEMQLFEQLKIKNKNIKKALELKRIKLKELNTKYEHAKNRKK
eukprot:556057_1